jgi:predicted DNA-binding transcriptional regulator AlpA
MNIEELIKDNPNISITINGSDLIIFAENIANKAVNDALEKREEKLYTREEVLSILKISPATLWRWQKLDIIKVKKLGQRSYFTQSEIDRLLKTNQ